MAFLLEYIEQVDVSTLRAGEISQCLLYLNHLSNHDARIAQSCVPVREKLNERLEELRKIKKAAFSPVEEEALLSTSVY